jgi:hypothetical protein
MSDQGQPLIPPTYDFSSGGGADNNQQPQSGSESLANDFLARVPESDREVVGRYVRDWDAGVTRRFQDIHARYEPYNQLGNYTDLAQYKAVFEYLRDNPEAVYKTLHETFGAKQQQQESPESEWGDLPPTVVQRLQAMDQQGQLLQALAERVLGMDAKTQEAQEDAELDKYMNWLSSTYGQFDEDYVLAKMSTGMDGAQAVAEFQQKYGGGQPQRQPFTVLSGGGAVGQQGTFNPAKASGQDVRNVVGEMLKLTNQQGQ